MTWLIEKNIVCPQTGSSYAVVRGFKKLRLIIHYRGEYFLSSGGELIIDNDDIMINNKHRNIVIKNVHPYTTGLWANYQNSTDCPGNNNPFLIRCARSEACLFEMCPYGLIPAVEN